MVALSEAKKQIGALAERANRTHEPIYLSKHGRRVAVIVDADEFDRIRELAEDAEDALAAEEALAEMEASGELPIPWEQVKAELGLV